MEEILAMIAFVDIEHPQVVADPQRGPAHDQYLDRVCQSITRATSLPCRPIRYTDLTPSWMASEGVRAIMISGNATDWCEYDWALFAPLQEAILQGTLPIMGFCGGHQFLALTLQGECGPLGPLLPGEADPYPGYQPGMRKEWGMLPVRIVQPDPLLDGLPSPFVVQCYHYWEVKHLPSGFEILAETDLCRVQMVRHSEKPWCSTQFHPEYYTDQYPAGSVILRNFCRTFHLL
jgi:GMP synthase-like glutamine amidotransferase